MPGSIRDRARHRVREHSHWVAAIDRALGHYGVNLTHSSLALGLTSSRLPSTPFIEQANANLLWIEASRLSGDEFFGLRLNRAHFPSAINLLALAASTTVTVGTAIEHLIRFFPIVSTRCGWT